MLIIYLDYNFIRRFISRLKSDAIDLQRNGRMGSSLIGVIVMPPYAKLPGKIKNNRISKHRVGLPLLLMREEVEILKSFLSIQYLLFIQ